VATADDVRIDVEKVVERFTPLFSKVRRRNDEDSISLVTSHELARDEPCFDGFPETDVICQ
jgi:hypothetical protein